jgi:TPR repeat protein
LVARADRLLAADDAQSARDLYELAADAGNATAAYKLGQTYDPVFLSRAAIRGIAADPAKALEWYRRAAQGGSSEAAARLAQLQGRDAGAADPSR